MLMGCFSRGRIDGACRRKGIIVGGKFREGKRGWDVEYS